MLGNAENSINGRKDPSAGRASASKRWPWGRFNFGWADTALNPLMRIGYYEDVTEKMGDAADDAYRFYTVPGMFHCRGGTGPGEIDAMAALVDWVEGGAAPDTLVATTSGSPYGVSQLLRPYPQNAVVSGSGDTMDAASWSCGE